MVIFLLLLLVAFVLGLIGAVVDGLSYHQLRCPTPHLLWHSAIHRARPSLWSCPQLLSRLDEKRVRSGVSRCSARWTSQDLLAGDAGRTRPPHRQGML
ncbi:hypothetical protein [Streptomyces sp. NPDC086989]|uniref:hypothetical protein n=1 Tax=Streptomyces sp. NPDC086989 TaxID=3365764 RepID=UPI00380CE8E9